MSRRTAAFTLLSILVSLAVCACALVPGVWPAVLSAAGTSRPAAASAVSPPKPDDRAELVPGETDALRVPSDVVSILRIRTTDVRGSTASRSLALTGSLALDANSLAHVHPRFEGEVVEIGTVADTLGQSSGLRQVRFGDDVKAGQLLAVLWSTALGEKKSEYVDTLSRLRMEQETLKRLETLFKDEAIPERNLREARRNVEAAEIAVVRVERTLQSWRLTDEEIAAVKAEAEAMRDRPGARDRSRERSWARLEIRAPFAGTVVEKNVAIGDIVGTTSDLFKLADLRRLAVWAHVYEEDLPLLLKLPRPIRWTLRLKSDPAAGPLTGVIEEIGDIIDPSQHTALVMGHVDNPADRLRAGQFIVATVELPPEPAEVEVPTSAVVEDGDETVVFVQLDPGRPAYALRHVSILRHTGELAYVRGARAADAAATLREGEHVVSSGALELRAALRDLQAAARAKK